MQGFKILAAGVFALAIVLGYMVGASGTPVASLAIPAAFGLVIAGLGLLNRPLSNSDRLSNEPPLKFDAEQELNSERASLASRVAPMRYGVALLCFAAGFTVGLVVGAKARLDGWLLPASQSIQLTWIHHKLVEPPSAEAAFYWLYMQGVLQERRLSDDQIKSLYLLQAKDWTLRPPTTAFVQSQQPSLPASAASSSVPVKGGFIMEEIMKQMKNGNPIVDQPPPKVGPKALPG